MADDADLGEHGFPVVCDHEGLFTVQHNGGVVEGLLRMLQDEVQVRHASLKDATEVPRDQSSTNRCGRKRVNRRSKGVTCDDVILYLLGPSSRQKESVMVASSSKNSVVKASHHRLSLSCTL